MESKGLLPCSEEPATCSCPETCESSPSVSATLFIQNISYFKDEIEFLKAVIKQSD